MSLNIKNEHVHALAREAARRTGLNQTSAIETALERFLEALDATEDAASAQRLAEANALLLDIDARMTPADRQALHTDDLYDASGLPR